MNGSQNKVHFNIQELHLPVIILGHDEQVIDYNYDFKQLLTIFPEGSCKITDIFDEWEYMDDQRIVLGKKREKKYIFIKTTEMTNEEFFEIYIGLETTYVEDLVNQVKELEKLNRELDAIIENSYDGIYITDHKGTTLKTNSAIERITGIPKEYYIGKSVDRLIKRGILSTSVTHKVVKQRRTVSVVQENYAGKETLITGSPVFNENGEIDKVVTNIRDLSDLNDLLKELTKVNELNSKYKKEIEKLRKKTADDGIVFVSEKMKAIQDVIERISDVDATVLLLGETGVGKDVLARNIYSQSKRCVKGDFIKINCGAIPPDLLESELFGYESGAFTGANRNGKPGMFELADGGILFLDEIGELPLPLQVKLLRSIQEREIQRIGGTKPKKVDVRIISATNRSLKEMVNNGQFREDLYYRLHVIPITIPPLRERREDILPLVDYFLQKTNQRYGFLKKMDAQLRDFFYHFHWPGNVREMLNLIERLVLTTSNLILTIEDLPADYQDLFVAGCSSSTTLKEAVEHAEKNILAQAVQNYQNTYEIAEVLDSSQATIVRKLKKYNLSTTEKTKP